MWCPNEKLAPRKAETESCFRACCDFSVEFGRGSQEKALLVQPVSWGKPGHLGTQVHLQSEAEELALEASDTG